MAHSLRPQHVKRADAANWWGDPPRHPLRHQGGRSVRSASRQTETEQTQAEQRKSAGFRDGGRPNLLKVDGPLRRSLLRGFPSGLAGGDRCQTRPSEVPAFDYGFRRRSQPLSSCASGSFELGDAALDRDDFVNIEIDVDGGPVQLTLPADTPGVEIAYILTLVPHMEAGVLELRDPVTGEVVFSLRLVLH